MKRLFLLTLLTTLLTASLAFGATIHFTGDNEITYFAVNGNVLVNTNTSTWDPSITGKLTNWEEVKTFSFDYDPSKTYTFQWNLMNYELGSQDAGGSTLPADGNPMGFIATVDLGNGTVLNSNLDDGRWEVIAKVKPLQYVYGTPVWNNRPDKIFTNSNWLSTALYKESAKDSGPAYMGVNLTIAPAATPIPGAAWLLGSGLIGLVGLRRKKA